MEKLRRFVDSSAFQNAVREHLAKLEDVLAKKEK